MLTADAGHHSEANLQQLAQQQIPALIAGARAGSPPSAFTYYADTRTCVSGKEVALSQRPIARREWLRHGPISRRERDCTPCALRAECLHTPATTPVGNVAFGRGRAMEGVSHAEQMRRRIDTDGRAQHGPRFATVEPVFGNVR